MVAPRKAWIGELLLKEQVVHAPSIERALTQQQRAPDRAGGLRLCSLLVEAGAKERAVLMVLARQLGVPGLVLSQSTIDIQALGLIPRAVAERHRVLPVYLDDDTLTLACADPGETELLKQVAFATGRQVQPVLALEGPLGRMSAFAYDAYAQGRQQVSGSAEGEAVTDALVSLEIVRPDLPGASLPADESFAELELSAPGFDAPLPQTVAQGATVLVVDDDDAIRGLLTKVLALDGYDVTEAATGREALELLAGGAPRLVILDAMLPEVHGFTLCQQLKQSSATAHVPVVMVSAIYRGWQHARDIQERHGADRFIEKPFDVQYLRRVVGELLGESAPPPPLSADVLVQVGHLRAEAEQAYERGDVERGLALADAWLALSSFDPVPHLLRGNLLHQKQDFAAALTSFEKAATFGPELYAAHKNLALAYERLGFARRAFERWRLARQHAPDESVRQRIDQRLHAQYAAFMS
jgi:CheY-like chemotaxis protein